MSLSAISHPVPEASQRACASHPSNDTTGILRSLIRTKPDINNSTEQTPLVFKKRKVVRFTSVAEVYITHSSTEYDRSSSPTGIIHILPSPSSAPAKPTSSVKPKRPKLTLDTSVETCRTNRLGRIGGCSVSLLDSPPNEIFSPTRFFAQLDAHLNDQPFLCISPPSSPSSCENEGQEDTEEDRYSKFFANREKKRPAEDLRADSSTIWLPSPTPSPTQSVATPTPKRLQIDKSMLLSGCCTSLLEEPLESPGRC